MWSDMNMNTKYIYVLSLSTFKEILNFAFCHWAMKIERTHSYLALLHYHVIPDHCSTPISPVQKIYVSSSHRHLASAGFKLQAMVAI